MTYEDRIICKRILLLSLFIFVIIIVIASKNVNYAALAKNHKNFMFTMLFLILGSFSMSNLLFGIFFKRAIFGDPEGNSTDVYIVKGEEESSTLIFSVILSTISSIIFLSLAYYGLE